MQNVTHSYSTTGFKTVSLTAYQYANTSITNTTTVVNYINVSPAQLSGQNYQDVTMAGQYLLTIRVTDSTTNFPILVATVIDQSGQTYVTTNGTAYLTEPYTVASGVIQADGYATRGWSAVVDNDTSVTYQVSPQSASNYSSIQYTTPHNVKVNVRSIWSGPVSGVNVTATYVETSGPWTWLFSWLGVLAGQGQANVQNTTLSGHTGDDGAVNFLMVESVQYNITLPQYGMSMTIYPKDDDYTMYIEGGSNGINGSALYGSCQPLDVVRTSVLAPKVNSTFGLINVTYLDTQNETVSVFINITQTHNYGNITNETSLFNTTVALNNFTRSFNITNPADQSYNVHINATTLRCGFVYRDYSLTFPPNPISMGLPDVLLPFIAMGLIIYVAFKFTRSNPGETTIAICFVGWLTYLMHWWDSQVDPVLMGASLAGFTILAIIYNVALRSKKLPMQ